MTVLPAGNCVLAEERQNLFILRSLLIAVNPLEYWKINSGRFQLLSKLAVEIYSCPATTAGIERVFSIAGHLIGARATSMKDDSFEKKLFCNVNQEALLSGRKRKFMDSDS